jgi:SAM-dependent methyltransferase
MEAVRNEYAKIGVENYYKKHSKDYRNPHEKIVHKLLEIAENKNYIGRNVIDLCCGSGEVTLGLKQYNHKITGVDPYTNLAYYNRTGCKAINLSFKDIVRGKLKEHCDTIICSFALHLCEKSMLPFLLYRLGEITDTLIIISPHKRPDCDRIASWILVDDIIVDRVRMKVYMK